MVDNEGAVRMYGKGWTTKCQLCNTILAAINEVAIGLHVDLFIEKIRRYSNGKAEAADALSKSDFSLFREKMPEANPGPERVPVALTKWIQNPLPDRFLGLKILVEMSEKNLILGYNV